MLREEKRKPKPLPQLISLQGKKAAITGCAAGIGKAIAYRFAEAGANLELIDIDERCLESVQQDLSFFKVEMHSHRVDLRNKSEIDALWHDLSGREPDILVNNAGIYPFKSFLNIDKEFLQTVMEINLNSVFWMSQHMIRSCASKGGTIINVGSVEAILPFKEGLSHYDISKAGVIALTRALAKEHGKDGFKINAILPGGIATRGTRNVAKELYKLNFGVLRSGIEFRSRLPIGRFGKPDEVARIALVLASDLSSYVHGALIPVDGGFLSA